MNNQNGNKSLMSMLFGAAVGAAAVYLSDRNNRDKVKTKWNELKEEGTHKVDEVKDKIAKTKEEARQEMDEIQDRMGSEND